jgi:soluble lytic murein transglycosylase
MRIENTLPDLNRMSPEVRCIGVVLAALVAGSAQITPAGARTTGAPAGDAAEGKTQVEIARKAKASAERRSATETSDSKPVVKTPTAGAHQGETAHLARYDAAIASVRGHAVSSADAKRVKTAFARIAAGDPDAARAERNAITDPVAAKLVDWYRLRSGFGKADEYRRFLADNPAWGSRVLIIRRYEEALFAEGGGAAAIKDHFKSRSPATGAGFAALASAHLAEGDTATATRLARTAWRLHAFSARQEKGFIERFGRLLTAADHKFRFDRLLMDDARWTAERNERAGLARRVLPLLPTADRKKAELRISAYLRSSGAVKKLLALPDKDESDWGLAFQRIQGLRRADKYEEAARRLAKAPRDADVLVSPDDWWTERRAVVYEALDARKPRLAYDVAKVDLPLSDNPKKDQSFHAGWLALRYLKDAAAAERHFTVMKKHADGPLSRAKSAYWLGRALEARGKRNEARVQYLEATRSSDTFHAHLARARLGRDSLSLHVVPPKTPTPEQISRFSRLDAARAVVIADKADLDASIGRVFLASLQQHLSTESELAMVAHLARSLGDTQMSVRIAKSAVARGFNLLTYSYPLHGFPSFTPLRTPIPEMALMLAIARQESEFNGSTKSGAGARGILQVMPITARHVCRDYRIKCDIPRLMRDNSYNTMIAAAYIGDRMREFGGSYVLGIAGYNAGPGRARQWSSRFGDPREAGVDTVDWIHRIPFEETREYVQKVLSNVQVYRARLGSGPVPVTIAADLARARRGAGTSPAGSIAADKGAVRAGAAP